MSAFDPKRTSHSFGEVAAPELVPNSVRASAGGFASAAAKVGATLGIFVLPQVKAHGGLAAVLVMMAIVSVLGRLGLIDYNGHIEIHSSLLNVVLRDQPQIRH